MKNILKVIGVPALGLALLAGTAQAELVLSGSTAGYFQGSSSGNTEVTNSLDGSFASYRTGVPVDGMLMKSGVQFDGFNFSNIHSGDSFGLGFITYFNGRTEIGTSDATANLEFWLNLTDPLMAPFKLTTITFGIDATVNTGGSLIPDVFTASFTQPEPVLIDGKLVRFTINGLPNSTEVREDSWLQLADVTVTFSPVPEPATYGIIASFGLMGVAAYRRFRGQKGQVAATA